MNRSKTARSISGAMPMPVSRTEIDDRRPRRSRDRSQISPPAVGVLRGVVEQVGDHLGEAHRVGVDDERRSRQLDRRGDGPPPRSAGGWSRPRGAPTACELDALPAQLDLAARDARDVEQVVDQAHHLVHLPLDHLADAPRGADRARS